MLLLIITVDHLLVVSLLLLRWMVRLIPEPIDLCIMIPYRVGLHRFVCMELNPSKCKYMVLLGDAHQRYQQLSWTYMYSWKECMSLNIWVTDNLSWSKHIQSNTKKAMKLIGLDYWKFYQHSSTKTLKELHISFIRPHMEYATSVWDPHCIPDVANQSYGKSANVLLENVFEGLEHSF